jgi:hypothetical protein
MSVDVHNFCMIVSGFTFDQYGEKWNSRELVFPSLLQNFIQSLSVIDSFSVVTCISLYHTLRW